MARSIGAWPRAGQVVQLAAAASSASSAPDKDVARLLRACGRGANDQWRAWARDLLRLGGGVSPETVSAVWAAVLDFDPVLRAHVERPVQVGGDAVIMTGSGKETLKTFNVSTAAGILAAAAGARVVKGVSSSVSAVSGSADVLAILGIPTCPRPEDIGPVLGEWGIAFVPYAAFCPRYAGRYDGVFADLTPLSFFMPASVIAVAGSAFVYGIAHPAVDIACRAITMTRPDLSRGSVVSSTIMGRTVTDEASPVGVTRHAIAANGQVEVRTARRRACSPGWTAAVAHRASHEANARAVVAALSPTATGACPELVEENAAIVWWEHHHRKVSLEQAHASVHEARVSGAAARFLQSLKRTR
jgi:anthranilate phosphoribosyltransferase